MNTENIHPPAPIVANNVERAWYLAKVILREQGVLSPSRAGDVMVLHYPMATYYTNPIRRVLSDPIRDANPFFHLFEAFWMLAGRNDVEWIKQYNARMVEYSDDGKTFHGAYGYRWRHWFDLDGGAEEGFTDQLSKVIAQLRADPLSRRAVVQMWDPRADLWSPNEKPVPKDLPCNTAIYFDCRDGNLNMTVTNRSNDIVWGCYGANVVHMSILQEYVAAQLGVWMGWYCQFSHNWHAYLNVFNKQLWMEQPYRGTSLPIVTVPDRFDAELHQFLGAAASDRTEYFNLFFTRVAQPMKQAWFLYKQNNIDKALEELKKMPLGCDWSIAATEWMERRAMGRSSKLGDAVLGA
jgi:thymidylate synthase